MGTFRITGGKKLSGIIKPQGAKNEAHIKGVRS